MEQRESSSAALKGSRARGAAVALIFALAFTAACSPTVRPAAPVAPAQPTLVVAVLPMQNLSVRPAPVREMTGFLADKLEARGVRVLAAEALEDFIYRHRVRYSGGLDADTAAALYADTGAQAVFISSVDLYSEAFPPKVALTGRLVSTYSQPQVLGMQSVSLAGDDSPGLLGIGLVEDPAELSEIALDRLLDTFVCSPAEAGQSAYLPRLSSRFEPKISYRSESAGEAGPLKVAVLPFGNRSERSHAGRLMMLQFVRELSASKSFSVVEPGIVRRAMLDNRVIMPEGVAHPDAEVMFSALEADIVLAGSVLEFTDFEGSGRSPRVDFSALLIEKDASDRTVVTWAGKSYSGGDDGVFFFDVGRVRTTTALTSRMVHAALSSITPE